LSDATSEVFKLDFNSYDKCVA
jgi:hypothetical protein